MKIVVIGATPFHSSRTCVPSWHKECACPRLKTNVNGLVDCHAEPPVGQFGEGALAETRVKNTLVMLTWNDCQKLVTLPYRRSNNECLSSCKAKAWRRSHAGSPWGGARCKESRATRSVVVDVASGTDTGLCQPRAVVARTEKLSVGVISSRLNKNSAGTMAKLGGLARSLFWAGIAYPVVPEFLSDFPKLGERHGYLVFSNL